jgi:hypothetical protein
MSYRWRDRSPWRPARGDSQTPGQAQRARALARCGPTEQGIRSTRTYTARTGCPHVAGRRRPHSSARVPPALSAVLSPVNGAWMRSSSVGKYPMRAIWNTPASSVSPVTRCEHSPPLDSHHRRSPRERGPNEDGIVSPSRTRARRPDSRRRLAYLSVSVTLP